MKKIRLLFQGDSITDGGRNYAEAYSLGMGYPKYAAKLLSEKYPDIDFEFINRGINGNQTIDLIARLNDDLIALQPDIVSVLIGFNDVWACSSNCQWLDDEVFEQRYRTILTAIKEKTKAKIMVLEPFLIPIEERLFCRADLCKKIEIIRKLSRQFADAYLPTDGLLQSAVIRKDPYLFACDGVHPTAMAAEHIGKIYCDYISALL